ncbi:hypothetical protein RCS94_05895 [Orbaceae bacterium ac157xtp]
MIAPSSYGALSATSANTIKGSAPWFKGQSGAKKLGFKIGNTTYSESEGNLSSTDDNVFDPALTPNHFQITALTANDFTVQDDYEDVNGDSASSTPFTMDSMSVVWKDRTNRVLTSSDMAKMLGCGGDLNLPLTLTITIPNVQVHSEYGDPRDSDPAVLEQNYKINTTQGFCFARPNSLSWAQDWGASGNSTNGGGYTEDFDPDNGFKAEPTLSPDKFPTTGFPGAQFTLIMTGNNSDWTFRSVGGSVVDANGKVTLNSKGGTGGITIKAKLKNSNPVIERSYTFKPNKVWVKPYDIFNPHSYAWAQSVCGSNRKIPTRAHLTNSPLINLAAGAGGVVPNNAHTRAIGGGVSNEWGSLNYTSYPESEWNMGGNAYWTREKYSSTEPFFFWGVDGTIGWTNIVHDKWVVCLK